MTIARKSWKKRTINPYFGSGDKMISLAKIGVKTYFVILSLILILRIEGGD
ncbi:MAG: hypothetical protein AMQ22_00622 [Candidatus Methanofastidiosum methylothiophilum]|uniref:Uncharacterized protein n=1 Tax=Candidatus Methanofastidiosum methylothiophilum TaxID=1705564 RepID=A0A150J675_9EURY|nr:MAG: hypothetical protein AMQ22_00622 [Candidatus Methanofastidiosum methylthiophilus]